jgi:hypothetical protein
MAGEMVVARSCEHFRLELMGPGPESGVTRLVIGDHGSLIALELTPEQVEDVAKWLGRDLVARARSVTEMTSNTGKT